MSEDKTKNDTNAENKAVYQDENQTIQVIRSVSETNDDGTAALETTKIYETTETGRKVSELIDETKVSYSIALGTVTTTTKNEKTVTKRKSGTLKRWREKNDTNRVEHKDGISYQMAGYNYEQETYSSYYSDSKYNREERLKADEIHAEGVNRSNSWRFDGVVRKNYGEKGNPEGRVDKSKYFTYNNMTKGMMAWGNASEDGADCEVNNVKGNRTFTGTINTNDDESYSIYKNGVGVEIKVDNEGVSGYREDVSTGEKEDLSKKQLKRALKAARREADKVISRVTNGQYDAVGEYMSGIGRAKISGELPPLALSLDFQSEQLDECNQKIEEAKPEFEKKVEQLRQITAEDVLKQRMMKERLSR